MEMARCAFLLLTMHNRVLTNYLHRANKVDSSVPWILLYSSLIFMVFKQYVNIIQMVEASKWLAEGDAEIRKQAGLPRGRKYQ